MVEFDWKSFLQKWSDELLDSFAFVDVMKDLPQEVRSTRWFGYPGATEEQTQQTEHRLGITLPPSYREFLKVSNGWWMAKLFSTDLSPVEEIDWLVNKQPDWNRILKHDFPTVSDEDYFVYGEDQSDENIRWEYLATALMIGNLGEESSNFLLNPKILTADGEWEMWFFGRWAAGASRFRSFQGFMEYRYQLLLRGIY